MKEKIQCLFTITAVIIAAVFVFSILPAVNISGINSFSGSAVWAQEKYYNVKEKEVYSCHDKTTLGSALLEVRENIGRIKTAYVSDLCINEKTLRTFACRWGNGKHYLVSNDINCEEQEAGSFCFQGQCVQGRMSLD